MRPEREWHKCHIHRLLKAALAFPAGVNENLQNKLVDLFIDTFQIPVDSFQETSGGVYY